MVWSIRDSTAEHLQRKAHQNDTKIKEIERLLDRREKKKKELHLA